MDRKFVIALSSLAGSMLLTEAHAIGLGEITLHTSLNEPLRADIQLLQLSDLSENEVLVNLASQAEFAKAGVERDFLLNSLRFELDLSDPKKPRVVVTTKQPIREPYLNFLVEVQWPSGRLLREYTLLMDLPAFNDVESAAGQGFSGTNVPASAPLPKESKAEKAEPAAAEPVSPPEEVLVPASETRPVAEQPAEEPAEVAAEPVKPAKPVSGGLVVRRATKEEIQNYRQAAAPAPAAEPVPETAAQPAPEEAPVEQEIAAQEAAEAEPAPAQEPAAAEEPVAAAPAEEPVAQEPAPSAVDEYGPTEASDTLWKIAQQVRSEGSIHQNMVAIQRMNPDAFINGNINQLKRGKVLRLPAPEEIAAVSNSEAVAEVGSQTASWQAKRAEAKAVVAGAQLDATARAATTEAPAAPTAEGQLKLATPGDAAAATAAQGKGETAPDAEKAALDNELAMGMEELTRVQRENQEYSSRVQDLDAQIVNAERLLELQSGELASMQAKLAEEEQARLAAEAQAKADADAKLAAEAKAAEEAKLAAEQQAKSEAEAKAAAEAQAKADADAKVAAEAKAAEEAKLAAEAKAAEEAKKAAEAKAAAEQPAQPAPEQAVAPAEPQPEAAAAPEAAPEQAETKPAPAAKSTLPPAKKPVVVQKQPAKVEEASAKTGSNTQVIGSVVGILLFLAGLFGYRRWSAKRAASAEVETDYAAEEVSYEAPAVGAEVDHELPDLDEEIAAATHEAAVQQAQPEEVAEPAVAAQQPPVDVLGEADIYISFGNFEKAESILRPAIQAEPSRTDYRLKLLELYKESDNLAAFDAAYKDLIELDDDLANEKAGALRSKLSAAASTPFAFGVSSVAAAAGIADDLDLDFDALEAETSAPAPAPAAEVAAAPAEESFDLDFDLDMDLGETAAAPAAEEEEILDLQSMLEEEAAHPAADDFDLDLNFDLDAAAPAAAAEPAPAAQAVEEAFDLDLAFDEPAAPASAPAEVSADDLGLDFDLDFAEPAPAAEAEPEVDVNLTVRRESFATQGLPVSAPVEPAVDSSLLEAVAPDAGEMDEELDFLTDADEAATKLDLARAYIDMGDKDGARDILEEVLEEGGPEQKAEAQQLLRTIGG